MAISPPDGLEWSLESISQGVLLCYLESVWLKAHREHLNVETRLENTKEELQRSRVSNNVDKEEEDGREKKKKKCGFIYIGVFDDA